MSKKLKPETVRSRVTAAKRKRLRVHQRASDMMSEASKVLDASLRELQERCPHENHTVYMGTPYDPSVRICDDCGKELE